MRNTLRCSVFATTVVAMALPALCQTSFPLRSVVRYQVKGDRITEFQEVEKQVAASYRKAGGDHFRVVFRDAIGSGQFWVISPIAKYGDRDAPNPYTKMTTEQERASRSARLSQCVEHVQSTIERSFEDLNITPTGAIAPMTWLRMTRTRVRNGKANDYIAALKSDLIPALKKMGVKNFRIRQVLYGGNLNDFTTSSGFEKWTELDDASGLAKAMGGDEAMRKYGEKMNEIVTGRERFILRYLPDLSYFPGQATTTTATQ